MKKYTLISLLVLSFQACTDLEESPESNLTVDQFYNTSEDAESAVNAIYHRMFTEWLVLYNRQLMMLEMATDDVSAGPRTRSSQVIDLSKINYVPNNTGLNWTWQYSYDAINRANIAIDRIALLHPDVIDSKLQNRLINEAKFLRAWNYFNLVRWFGSVPLILKETSSLSLEKLQVSNTAESQIYEQIIKDLEAAEALPIPGSYADIDAGRATAGAAKILLAKVYLRKGEWQKSAAKTKELMDSGWYGLFEEFASVFSPESKNGKEHIFSIQFNGDASLNNGLSWFSLPFEFNGEYVDAPNPQSDLYQSYQEGDTRRNVTFAKELSDPTTGAKVTLANLSYVKYFDPEAAYTPQLSRVNIPLLRYADVLLMHAEALNELEGPSDAAYEAVDKVRKRAHVAPLKEIAPSLNKEAFRDKIYEERRKELALEYHRWFDLTRRGADYYVKMLHRAGKTNAAPRHVKFPIPQRELLLNPNLKQSPEWEGY